MIRNSARIAVTASFAIVAATTASHAHPVSGAGAGFLHPMIAGVFLPFGLRLMGALDDSVSISGAMAATYLAAAALPPFRARIPPLLAALFGGAVAVAATGSFAPPAELVIETATPILFAPVFSTAAIVEFSIPLAITVVAIHNIQGFAILRNAGYAPPENAATLICGAATPYYGIMGSVPTVVMGPANAILNGSGQQSFRYIGGLWLGLLLILFGVYAPTAVAIGGALPTAFIACLAGLALLPVLQSAFVESFRGRFTFGALITLLITVADIEIFGIGSAFWGLMFGYVASRLVESGDFRARKENPPA